MIDQSLTNNIFIFFLYQRNLTEDLFIIQQTTNFSEFSLSILNVTQDYETSLKRYLDII